MVVGDDDLEAKRLGALEGFPCGDPVVDGDQQSNALSGQLLHHRDIQPIAIGLAAGDGRLRLRP